MLPRRPGQKRNGGTFTLCSFSFYPACNDEAQTLSHRTEPPLSNIESGRSGRLEGNGYCDAYDRVRDLESQIRAELHQFRKLAAPTGLFTV
jgi:hypothetical protein